MGVVLSQADVLCLHIPFCGGTWVRNALKAVGIETRNAILSGGLGSEHGLRSDFREQDQGKFAIAFVRHPVRWYESFFVRARDNAGKTVFQGRRFLPYISLYTCLADNFSQFIENCLSEYPGFVSDMYEKYVGSFDSPNVNFIGLQEFLLEDLYLVLNGYGYEVNKDDLRKVPAINIRPSNDTRLDGKLRKALIHSERKTMERFFGD